MTAIFDKILAFHCAPALTGLKPANLFSYRKDSSSGIEPVIDDFNRKFNSLGLYIKKLCECDRRYLFLVYNRTLSEENLLLPEKQALLERFGYTAESSLEEKLELLASRIISEHDFPHEIGLFLGYPIEDVTGFIRHSGKNYKFCGYWKVYGDVSQTCALFQSYTECRDHICGQLCEGVSIHEAVINAHQTTKG